MNRADWVFSIRNDTRGIARKLGEGLDTRIFVGDNVMLSVVRIAPRSSGTVHSHPESNGACCSNARARAFRETRRSR